MLKPNVANILLFNFCEQKFVQYDPITTALDCNGLSLLIFEEKWPNYASAPNRNLFRTFCADSRGFFLATLEEYLCFSRTFLMVSWDICNPSDSFWVRRLFKECMRVFCALNATILLVYMPAKIKMSFIRKDDFFCQNRNLL